MIDGRDCSNEDNLEYYKNIKWIDIPGLYRLFIAIDNFQGHENVVLDIFRSNIKKVPFDPLKFVPKTVPEDKINEKPSYVLIHIKESFTLKEIKEIKEFFKRYKCIKIVKQSICSIPEDGSIWPTSAHPYDGWGIPTGFIDFYRFSNYNLSFEISGFYDIRCCDHIHNNKNSRGVIE
jgi:hypothetical protein